MAGWWRRGLVTVLAPAGANCGKIADSFQISQLPARVGCSFAAEELAALLHVLWAALTRSREWSLPASDAVRLTLEGNAGPAR